MLLEKLRQESEKIFNEMPSPSYRYGLSILLDPKINFNEIIKNNSFNFLIKGKTSAVEIKKFSESIEYQTYLGRLVNHADDKFTAFHFSNLNDGIFIRVKDSLENPIEIMFDAAGKTQFNHIVLVAEKNARADIIIKCLNAKYHSNIFEIFAKKESKINLVNIAKNNLINFTIKRASLENSSTVNFFDIFLNNGYLRAETTGMLNEPKTECNIKGIFMQEKDEKADVHVRAFHNSPYTKSDILTRGIAKDNSKLLTRGLVKIAKQSENSNGYQKSEALLIGEQAEAYSIPNLEIENNNVRCTHASSVSHIDEEKLFYLMSRGLSEKEAENQIVNGFLNSILNKINFDVEF